MAVNRSPEAVVLALRRKDPRLLIAYLRNCGGRVHPLIVKELCQAEWELHNPTLMGGKFRRCNEMMKCQWDWVKQELRNRRGHISPDSAQTLAKVFEDHLTPSGISKVVIKTRRGSPPKKRAVDKMDAFQIACFIAKNMPDTGMIPDTLIHDAEWKYGLSRATIYRLWNENREKAISATTLGLMDGIDFV